MKTLFLESLLQFYNERSRYVQDGTERLIWDRIHQVFLSDEEMVKKSDFSLHIADHLQTINNSKHPKRLCSFFEVSLPCKQSDNVLIFYCKKFLLFVKVSMAENSFLFSLTKFSFLRLI